jgi:hypothetical protein
VKPNRQAAEGPWQNTHYANLVRYKPSKKYFARIRINGKLIRRSLKTTVLSVAKLRLGQSEPLRANHFMKQNYCWEHCIAQNLLHGSNRAWV